MFPEFLTSHPCLKPQRRALRRHDCCLRLQREIERPDLAIYSQVEEWLAGREPTWDNPDIWTHSLGPFALLRETSVRVYNRSPSVLAVNALVHLHIFPFGIGTPTRIVATRRISLAPSASSTLFFPLEESVLSDPRIGVNVHIEHPHDAVPINNSGAQAVDAAFTSEAGRSQTIDIPVVNNAVESREIRLEILPTDLRVTVSPASRVFAPGEAIRVMISIEIPEHLHGSSSAAIERRVTVVGRGADGGLIGGITRIVEIDN